MVALVRVNRVIIETSRLRLRPWTPLDLQAFADLNADPEVMKDQGGVLSREASDAKFDRYVSAFRRHGFCRWAIDHREKGFIGYAGLMPSPSTHPLGPHVEIGWRLIRHAWDHGFATEAARAALRDGFERVALDEIVAYTSADNIRSLRVMDRLDLQRDSSRDFTAVYDGVGAWHGRVWVGRRS